MKLNYLISYNKIIRDIIGIRSKSYFISNPKLYELSELLYKNNYLTNPSYSDILSNKTSSDRMNAKRLRDKLDTIYLTIPNQKISNSKFQENIILLNKKICILNQHKILGHHKEFLDESHALLKLSKKFLSFNAEITAITNLIETYSTTFYDAKKYTKYKNIFTKLILKYENYEKMRYFYYEASSRLYTTDYKNYFLDNYNVHSKAINESLSKLDYYEYIRIALFLKIQYYIFKDRIKEGVNFCTNLIDNVIKQQINWQNLLINIHLSKIRLLYIRRKYTTILDTIKIIERNNAYSENKNIYSRFIVFKIISLFHVKRYDSAEKIINNVLPSLQEDGLYKSLNEFIVICFMIICITTNSEKRNFYYYKNTLKIALNDKKGLNVIVEILTYIYMLRKHKYSSTYDSARNLQQYAYRHLKGKEHVRARGMIKNLIAIPKYNFDLLKLDELPKTFGTEDVDSSPNLTFKEIIPYENLWEITLEILENNLPEYQRERLQRARAKRDAGSTAPQA